MHLWCCNITSPEGTATQNILKVGVNMQDTDSLYVFRCLRLALNSNWFLSQSDSQWVQLRVWNFLELKTKQFSRSLFAYLPQSFIYRRVSCTGSKLQKPFRSKHTECCYFVTFLHRKWQQIHRTAAAVALCVSSPSVGSLWVATCQIPFLHNT